MSGSGGGDLRGAPQHPLKCSCHSFAYSAISTLLLLDLNMDAMLVPYSKSLLKVKHVYFLFMVHFGKKYRVDEFNLRKNLVQAYFNKISPTLLDSHCP